MASFDIRPVSAADLDELLEMVEGLAAHHGDAALVTADDLARDCLGDAPWLRVIVAQRGARLLGYAALCPLAQLQFGARGMDMHHLFVRREARKQGVARALISASVELACALECQFLTVGTHPENEAAGQVYLASGFDALPPPGPRFRCLLS
jgi:GNAT superfamily N-acetyltransferase